MKKSNMLNRITVAIVLTAILLAGCTSNSDSGNTAKPTDTGNAKSDAKVVTVKYVVPGSDQPGMKAAIDAVNKKLLADGLSIQLDVQHIGWDAWNSKTNIMLSTGEEFDLMHVMENSSAPTGAYVARGAALPLDDLIMNNAPDLMNKFPQSVWDAAKVNGKIYTIPAMWRDSTQMGGEAGYITVRQDLLDKLNLPIPKTVDELINTGVEIKKLLGNDTFAWDHALDRTPVWLHRTYDTWPFYADFTTGIVYVDERGNVKSWIETPEFKQDSLVYRKLYQAGLIHPDVLSLPNDAKAKLVNQGKFVYGLGTIDLIAYPGIKKNVPDVNLSTFQLSPEKVNYTFMPLMNSNIIPSTSKHPEAAIKFLDWLYKDQANHDLFLYGIEGQDYNNLPNGRIDYPENSNSEGNYAFDFWQIGYYKWQKFQKDELDESVKRQTTTDPNAQNSIVAGFTFNPETVKTEYANVVAEMASIYPIKIGVVDFDKNYPTALKKLKDAGLDKVVAEYNKQFQEFLKNKKG
ncbi:extracellular solute-binding protein [Cohnella suwonensis]|uniref:Extracellular solute-binding protein n=1 Tax=Cohnella suwonensis TaxID=696072 RepID=A0ABW0LNP1_9BACL